MGIVGPGGGGGETAPSPAQSGIVFVSPTLGSDGNSGGSSSSPKKTIKAALEALPKSAAFGERNPLGAGTYGTCVLMAGTFQVESKVKKAKCKLKTAKGEIWEILEPGSITAADVGSYILGQPSSNTAPLEGTYIVRVFEEAGKELFEASNTKEGTAEETLRIVKPAFVLPAGVQLIGQGRGSGIGEGYPTTFPTLIEDIGSGITIIFESGTGEKQKATFARVVMESLTIKGNQPTVENPEAGNMYGFAGASVYGEHIRGVLCIEHGQWGGVLWSKAAVIGEIEDCEFRNNGPVNYRTWPTSNQNWFTGATYALGQICFAGGEWFKSLIAANKGNKPSTHEGTDWEKIPTYSKFHGTIEEVIKLNTGGLWLAPSPNTFATKVVRCIENSGNGLEATGVADFGSVFSHNKATPFSVRGSGAGIQGVGPYSSGGISTYGGWIEGNEESGINCGTAIVSVYSCMFQGDGKTTYAIEGGGEPLTVINCVFQNNTNAAIKEGNTEGPIQWVGCKTKSTKKAEEEEVFVRRHTKPNIPLEEAYEGNTGVIPSTAFEELATGLKAAAEGLTAGVSFERNATRIRLKGRYEVESGKAITSGSKVFKLPERFRPSAKVEVTATRSTGNETIKLTIETNGEVKVGAELVAAAILDLDGVTAAIA